MSGVLPTLVTSLAAIWLGGTMLAQAPAKPPPRDPFRVGVFEGIKPGVSTAKDAVAKWGTPSQRFKNGGRMEVLHFKKPNRSRWDVEVWCSGPQSKVNSVFVIFDGKKTKAEVERIFGLNLRWKSYRWDLCIESGGASPVYEVAEGGELDLYEDRAHGAVGLPVGIEIRSLEFHDRRTGSPTSQCAARERR